MTRPAFNPEELEAIAIMAQVPLNAELGCRVFAFGSDLRAQGWGMGRVHQGRQTNPGCSCKLGPAVS